MGSLHSIRPALPLAAPDNGCLGAFEQELDYLFGALQRLGAPPADIEDLLQEIFLILHRRWPTLEGLRPLRPWLFGVAFRVVRAHRRHHARGSRHDRSDPQDGPPTPETWLQGQESVALLSAALQHLPVGRRSVLTMHELEGVEIVEIARRLSLTKFGVYARLYRARKELKAAVRRLLKAGLGT